MAVKISDHADELGKVLVRDTGIEPVTSTVSKKGSGRGRLTCEAATPAGQGDALGSSTVQFDAVQRS
jgi:hypothetical protein